MNLIQEPNEEEVNSMLNQEDGSSDSGFDSELKDKIEYFLIAMQDGNMARRMVINEVISLFRQVMDEVIGKDDEAWCSSSHKANEACLHNELREEQRERLKKILN